MGPLAAALIGAGTSMLTNVFNAREASKNRAFQERMSSTAHQREVTDLRRAGINPLLSARLGGSSTPAGGAAQLEDPGRGASSAVASALAVKQARAQIDLLESQARREDATASFTNAQQRDLETQAVSGRYTRLADEAELARLSVEEKRQMIPLALQQAREQVRLTVSSARQTEALAILNELASARAENLAAFEKRLEQLGLSGQALRVLLELVRGMPR